MLLGNPTLKAESLINIEAGIKHQREDNFSLFSNIFLNQYTDMIDFIYTIPVRSINREVVNGIGFEFGSNIVIEPSGTNINFTYSYLDMENIRSSVPLLYRPKHKIRLTLLQKTPIADILVSTRYTSTQLYEDFLNDDDDDWLDYIAQASHEELERQSTEEELYDFMERNESDDN